VFVDNNKTERLLKQLMSFYWADIQHHDAQKGNWIRSK